MKNLSDLSLTDRCGLLSALRRSFSYLQYNYLRCETLPSSRVYWLGEIREAYQLYRKIDFEARVRAEDRYASLVKFTTKERI
jgi:hypothetical protein